MTVDVIRLIAGGLLALISCYGGVLVKRHYIEREKFYADAEEFASYLGSELAFKKTPLPQAAERFCYGKKSLFVKTLGEYMAALKRGDSAEKMLEKIDVAHLKTDEKKNLLSFFSELGKTALEDQLANINRAVNEFSLKKKKCADESKKLGGMYFKLAVLLGIALIIILA